MNGDISLTVTLEADAHGRDRYRATDANSGLSSTARRIDTAIGRLVLLLCGRGRIRTGPNLWAAVHAARRAEGKVRDE